MNLAPNIREGIAFGRFRVFPHRRELLADEEPIKLGGRAFDLLMALIETPGAVVDKDDLLARVWPDRVVAETNLPTQILALRQAFGAERNLIRTVAGRGYQFTGGVRFVPQGQDRRPAAAILSAEEDTVAGRTNLPQPVSDLIGRDAEVEDISNLVQAGRLVTLTGAGGIGKTRLALAIARQLAPMFHGGVWLVELSPLSDPKLVPAAVAAAVGLDLGGGEASVERVAQALATRRLLMVLDTCEHLIDAAAIVTEALLRAGSAIQIIATSREPLRVEGEQLYPVPPLAVPPEDADHLWEYGAVRLFVARAQAAMPDLAEDQCPAATVAAICRRLDGIPLAIEMAAACVATLGVEELACRLDDRFQLLTAGRRTSLPRHQTLRATLDWSHDLLAEPERVLFRRLAVFAGAFSLEATGAVVASAEIASTEIVDGLSRLVAKSLVVAQIDGAAPSYRLLDTTRAYALDKLAGSGERGRLAYRHANYYRDFFERAEAELATRPTAEWLGDYGRQIDNLRAALDWAFSPGGDVEIGAALAAAAGPLWIHLSLLEECRDRVEQALSALGDGANADARRAMKLYAALGVSLVYGVHTTLPMIGATWSKALEIAEDLDDVEYQLRALLGLWFCTRTQGRHRVALGLAERFCALAASRSDPNDQLVGERLVGVSEQFMGDLPSARRRLEHMLAHYVAPTRNSHIIRFQGDQRLTARTFLGRVLWLQGFPDQAMGGIEQGVQEAHAGHHVNSWCYLLANAACPIALQAGRLDLAEYYTGMLIDLSTRHSLGRWLACGVSHQGVLVIKRGDVAGGLQILRSGLEGLGPVNSSFRAFTFVGDLAEALGHVGRIDEGLQALERAILRADETEERWSLAEALRIKGRLMLLQGTSGAEASAEEHFRQALGWARRQEALAWELRAATSLAQLFREQGRYADGLALLQPIYDRFTEGFETADLRAAKALVNDLCSPGAKPKAR